MGNFMSKLVKEECIGTLTDGTELYLTTDYRPTVIGVGGLVVVVGGYYLVNVTRGVLIPKIREAIKKHKKNDEVIVEIKEES